MDASDVEALIEVDTARKVWYLERLRALMNEEKLSPEAATVRILNVLIEERLGP
jgi:hypothetical protein